MEKKRRKRVYWDSAGIRALRSHLGMTQQELADELGMRQQTISEWETGVYSPRGSTATLLSIIAERANFAYRASRRLNRPGDDILTQEVDTKPAESNPGASQSVGLQEGRQQ
jgi:transcriptional regulator with XRE-family HTH domain